MNKYTQLCKIQSGELVLLLFCINWLPLMRESLYLHHFSFLFFKVVIFLK